MSFLTNVETFLSNSATELGTIANDVTSYTSSAGFKALATALTTLLGDSVAVAEAADPEVAAVLNAGGQLLSVLEQLAVAVEDAWKVNF